ncbi:hypothetical protein GCM10009081_22420 [Brevundimonas nasdae]
MKVRLRSTGYRQAAWDALKHKPFESVRALADVLGCSADGLRSYIAALEAHQYIQRGDDGVITLVKKTGPRAPSWSVHSRELRDWNQDPAMSADALKKIVSQSGLSDAAWLRAIGKHEAGATRLRQMMNGQRPVSTEMAQAAKAFASGQLITEG